MEPFQLAFLQALNLLVNTEAEGRSALMSIVWLSIEVALSSTLCSCILGLPLGSWLATHEFPGRKVVVSVLNAMLGLPSVIVGLIAYLLLSRSGPLGSFGLLFTPTAMVIAQTILITPTITALTRQTVETAWMEYRDLFQSIRAGSSHRLRALLWDCRMPLLTVVLTALGRALSEVGAVMTVGGNIAGHSRVMTTAIALETSKGDLPLALALGILLLLVVFTLMLLAQWAASLSESGARLYRQSGLNT
jgi:tungstate transport system permease protein